MSSCVLFVHGLASENFGNHVTHYSHLGSTAIVKLDIKLARLLLGVLNISTKVTNTIVSIILGRGHPCELNESKERKDLSETSRGNGPNTVNTRRNVGELQVVGGRKVSVKHNVVVVHNGSDDGHHSNASVLALDGTAALERLGFGLKPAERVENAEGFSYSEFELVHHVHLGRTAGGRSGGEGCGGAGEQGDQGELHFFIN
mmetsp:Transcript_53510/g.64536  ORF Transcript_53510/g.64536 Transcript_53510/m.64536 type:complete len:202 (-) Transcript_53510:101-706(-)